MIAARAGEAWRQSVRSSRPMAAEGATGRRGWFRAGAWAAFLVIVLVFAACARDRRQQSRPTGHENATAEPVATFSIVAYDPDTGDLGVAVQSRFFGVGSVVPWARAGVGAVATQALANTTYGPRGLGLLAAGASPEQVVAELTAADSEREQRQLAVVDASGRAATFTGSACIAWAGGRTGAHYAAQGNLLADPAVIDAMVTAYELAEGDLATRLVAALAAGQAGGGDARGRQSAALLVVRKEGGYLGFNDRYVDLRVEDHPAPIRELRRLLDLRHANIAARQARHHLGSGEPALALEAAQQATTLSPDEGSVWMLLAAARLALGDQEGAAAAGREALVRDPWLKKALLGGLLQAETLNQLLTIESFARFWETIPAPSH